MISKTMIRNLVYECLPPLLKRKLLRYSDKKKMQRQREIFKTRIDSAEIDKLFDKLALDSDVLIHSSLNDLGRIEGNMKYIARRLQSDVTDKGHTILCPAMAIKGSSLEFLKTNSLFDVRYAGNAMGAVSRYYGGLAESCRSLSPTHSVIAYGKDANEYTSEHHLDITPFSEHSPYMKLILRKGKILMLGAQLKSLTICHVLEDMLGDDFPVNIYDAQKFSIKVIDRDGKEFDGTYRAHSKHSGIFRDSDIRTPWLLGLDSTKIYDLGVGKVTLLDAVDIMICQLQMLKKGLSVYGNHKVSGQGIKKIDLWITRLSSL